MKKLILMTSVAAVALWGNALMAQTPNPAPAAEQSKVQKRDRTHVPDGAGAQAQNKQQNSKANKGKYGPADGAGNKGAPPNDGTGYGAKSGNQSGPADGTGSRHGDWQSGQRGQAGPVGGRGSGGRGGRR